MREAAYLVRKLVHCGFLIWRIVLRCGWLLNGDDVAELHLKVRPALRFKLVSALLCRLGY